MTDEQRRLQSDILSYSLERFSCFSTVTLNGRQEYEKEVFATLAAKSQHLADKKHYAQGSFMVLVIVLSIAKCLERACFTALHRAT